MYKRFSDVKVGDKIHFVRTNSSLLSKKDNYGNVFHDGIIYDSVNISSITIHSKVPDSIVFNLNYDSYRDNVNFELALKKEHYHLHIAHKSDKIYFADPALMDTVLRKHALAEIKRFEDQIKKFENERLRDIEEVRKNYFRVLNNV